MHRYIITTSMNINEWLEMHTTTFCDIYCDEDGTYTVTTTDTLASDSQATVEEI